MPDVIFNLLRNIDQPTLRRFAGTTVLRAISAISPAQQESQIVEVLIQKFGDQILAEKEIRLAILDSMSAQQAADFCKRLSIPVSSHAANCVALQNYFTSWSTSKSEKFVSLFGLSAELIAKTVNDSRSPREYTGCEYGQQVALKGYLHPYQKRIKDQTLLRLNSASARQFLIQMPTGSGKTFTALEAVVDLFRAPGQNGFFVWLVNSNELAEQALDSFRFLWTLKGDRPIETFRFFGNFSPNFQSTHTGAVFTSFPKLNAALSNPSNPSYHAAWHLLRNTRLLTVDEAHTSIAPTYNECVRAFLDSSNCQLLGLTATPGRNMPIETEELVRLYSGDRIEITDDDGGPVTDPIGYLQSQNYLANIDAEVLETSAVATGDDDTICKTLAENAARNQLIMDQITLAAKALLPTIVFACTLDHVFAIKVLCVSASIDCRVITGATPQYSRIQILEGFRRGDFCVLINLDILSTGVDLPNVRCLIITRPVGSPILYSQILGRALRGPKNGGQPSNRVITLKDNLLNYPTANLAYSYFSDAWNNH
jgi:DNA repair protein RadD